MTRAMLHEADHEERLNEVLLAYIEELQAGGTPDRQQLLIEHAALRDDLETFFASRDEIDRLAAPLRTARGKVATDESGRGSSAWIREPPLISASGLGLDELTKDLGHLGDFQILREIGRGGMGVVYEAQQISLRRRVALKVLPFAAAIDQRQLQRFKNEALAAAHLQHSNIVPVHAVGCERGVHFYAMQFIEGQSLSELIRDLCRFKGERNRRPNSHSTQDEPAVKAAAASKKLTRSQTESVRSLAASTVARSQSTGGRGHFDWVARLGQQAALALEHAHQTGIVHRDIKPSNLLLDPLGQLWVTDFGLAQIGGDSALTATGELLGTLRYASPEQALARRGLVDHRSDIYSLGATLFELLALRPVFEGSDRGELLRQIVDEDPPLLRSLEASIPQDLDTIILKTLRKIPGERYATAQDLADDLHRYLDGRPILARRPTVVERVRKWERRHPSVVVTGIVVLILLSAGSISGVALLRMEQNRTARAQKAAEVAFLRERERAEEAESRFQIARRSVDELIQVSEEELAHRSGMEGLRQRLLTSALAYYQEFAEQRSGDQRTKAQLSDTTRRVEQLLADLAVLRASRKFHLLAQPAVLDDLRLAGDQRTKIKNLAARLGKQWMDSYREFGRLSPAERGRQTLERARNNEAEVNAILSAAQQLRLQQIGLQLEGPRAFRKPEVETALQLTPDQHDQIQKIEREATWNRSKATGPGMSPGGQSADPEFPDRPPIEQILDLLTERQKQTWKDLVGEPFGQIVRPHSARAPS